MVLAERRAWGQSPMMRAVRVVARHRLGRIAAVMILILCILAVIGPTIAPYPPALQHYDALSVSPSTQYWLGTDNLGRDQLSRLLYGARVSLVVGLASVILGASLGVPLGLTAGYLRGAVDQVVMRIVDGLMAFPHLLMAIVLVAALGTSVTTIVFAIAFSMIARQARLARGQALTISGMDYILAARACGASRLRIIFRHVWPNATDPIIVASSLSIAGAIIAEASLSFLGLGVPPPAPTWGSMLKNGFPYLEKAPWISLVPGFAIFVTVLSFNIFGDVVRDALDPRIRQE